MFYNAETHYLCAIYNLCTRPSILRVLGRNKRKFACVTYSRVTTVVCITSTRVCEHSGIIVIQFPHNPSCRQRNESSVELRWRMQTVYTLLSALPKIAHWCHAVGHEPIYRRISGRSAIIIIIITSLFSESVTTRRLGTVTTNLQCKLCNSCRCIFFKFCRPITYAHRQLQTWMSTRGR